MSSRSVSVDAEGGNLLETEVDAFINERWLITVRENENFAIEPVLRRWDRSPDLAIHGVGFLLYGLLDVIVDEYFESISAFDDYYEVVSEGIFTGRPLDPAKQRHWFEMRRAMVRFHRLTVPMREAVSALMRREHSSIPEERIRTIRTSTTTSCELVSRQTRCATWSARSSRRTSACATTTKT